MMKFADVHSHFVYGVDDGAKTQEEMKAMLDAAWQDDVTTLVATPHRTPGVHPFDEALFERRLAEARDYCQLRSYAMNLWAGAEILYTPALEQYMTCHPLPTLGSTRNVLRQSPIQRLPQPLNCWNETATFPFWPMWNGIER